MSKVTIAPIDGGYLVKREGRVHGTLPGAEAEAVRLTERYPDGPAFMILKVVGMVVEGAVAHGGKGVSRG